MDIQTIINENKVILKYEETEEFDAFILVKHENALKLLNPEITIRIETFGFVPLEISSYICEVSKHCYNIILEINDDESTHNYILDIIKKLSIKNIYINFSKSEA